MNICLICKKGFKSLQDLKLHQTIVYKYNKRSYQELAKIFNNPNWRKKFYNQNQQTYVVCKNSDQFANIIEHSIEKEEIDLLELLVQNNLLANQQSNKSKRSQVFQEE
ncbi:17486_t:CDS:2, partial [Cetraspora pellucida]